MMHLLTTHHRAGHWTAIEALQYGAHGYPIGMGATEAAAVDDLMNEMTVAYDEVRGLLDFLGAPEDEDVSVAGLASLLCGVVL